MRKHKNSGQGRRRSSRKRKVPTGPVFFEHPFARVPRERLIPVLVEHAKRSKSRFRECVNETLAILSSNDPLQTITMLAVYGLFGGIASDGTITAFSKDGEFSQAHVELVQALALTLPPECFGSGPPHAATIQKLFELLPSLSKSFAHQRMAVMEEDRPAEQKAVTLIQELLRMHTQSVRNWGFFDKVSRIALELYKPLDRGFIEHVGIGATQIIAAFVFLVRNSEENVNRKRKPLGRVLRKRSVNGIIREFYKVNPQLQDSPEDLIAVARLQKFGVDQTKALIIAYCDFCLPDAFIVSAASMASVVGAPEGPMASVLKMLSLAPGELSSHNPEHLLLDNPVWRKPLIDLGNGRYFCAMPQMFFSFLRPILDGLVGDNQSLMRDGNDRRAGFLETELARLFATAFPGAEIVAGFRWKDGDTEYENDLIVRVDSHLILIEAKSGAISWPALRGAPERAKHHVHDLFLAPSKQSARLAERITAVARNPDLRASYLPDLNVRIDQVRTILRLSVTLEDFAMTQSNLTVLQNTGWIPQGHALAPCILLTDLEVIFDVLERTGQKIHYLRRRVEIGENVASMGDELDHLGFYLATGFNINDGEFAGAQLHLIGMSKEIDQYYAAYAEGIVGKKPRLRLSKWWSDICATLEQRQFYQWTDANNILLSLSLGEQKRAETMFRKVKANVLANWKDPSHQCSVMVIPDRRKSDAVALYAFRDADSGNRRERMESVASQVFAHPHVARCLVLGINIDTETYPYGTLMVFFAGDDSPQSRTEDLVVY